MLHYEPDVIPISLRVDMVSFFEDEIEPEVINALKFNNFNGNGQLDGE